MSSPRVVQSASWQSASWRIRELSSNPAELLYSLKEITGHTFHGNFFLRLHSDGQRSFRKDNKKVVMSQ